MVFEERYEGVGTDRESVGETGALYLRGRVDKKVLVIDLCYVGPLAWGNGEAIPRYQQLRT